MQLENSNPVLNQIFSHRSIRRFDPNFKIPRDHVDLIIKAGQQAASSCSGQTYSIIEVDPSYIESILPLCGNQKFVSDGSVFFLICVDLARLHNIVEHSGGKNQQWPMTGFTIGVFDAGLMGQNMVLAAESLGYTTCFCGSCADQPDKIIDLLKLPPLVLPLTGLSIGKATEDPPIRPRLPTQLIHHRNVYRQCTRQELEEGIRYMSEKLAEEGYYSKYSGRENYTWKEHMKNKFGGNWLNGVEERRIAAMKRQEFLS